MKGLLQLARESKPLVLKQRSFSELKEMLNEYNDKHYPKPPPEITVSPFVAELIKIQICCEIPMFGKGTKEQEDKAFEMTKGMMTKEVKI